MSNLLFQTGQRVLFQGDSITDAGRDREAFASLGSGYANLIAAWLSAKYPDFRVEFLNRGISGNTIPDLETRWMEDCIDLKPDWLSILIGINDTARNCNPEISSDAWNIPQYEACYRKLLDRVKSETSARVIIMEPFLLPVTTDRERWREDLDLRIQAVRRVARDYGAILIPLDGIFAAVCSHREPAFWSADGVHTTGAGGALIAQAWINAVSL